MVASPVNYSYTFVSSASVYSHRHWSIYFCYPHKSFLLSVVDEPSPKQVTSIKKHTWTTSCRNHPVKNLLPYSSMGIKSLWMKVLQWPFYVSRIGHRPLILRSILCERFVYKLLHVPFMSLGRVGNFLLGITCGTAAYITSIHKAYSRWPPAVEKPSGCCHLMQCVKYGQQKAGTCLVGTAVTLPKVGLQRPKLFNSEHFRSSAEIWPLCQVLVQRCAGKRSSKCHIKRARGI